MPIEVRIDDRVRAVSSVMLLTDFVDENKGCGERHPLKVRTIEYLEDFADHPCAVAAGELSGKQWMCAFHRYTILLPGGSWADAVPTLMPSKEHPLMDDTLWRFADADFGSLLGRFYADTRLQTLWDKTMEEWEAAREDCAHIVRNSRVEEFFDILFGKYDCPLVVAPNPLDPPTFGFCLNDGHTTYAALGAPVTSDRNPSGRYANDPRMTADLVFHEFSHVLWRAARDAYPAIVDETASLQNTMEYRGYFPKSYDTWDCILDEIVIRAATAHYVAHRDGDLKAQAFLDHEKQEYGIDLIDTVFHALGRYMEARRRGEYDSLSQFVPALSEIMRTGC